MEESRERSEKLLREALNDERERAERLLKEQHERLTAALAEEQGRQEDKVKQTLQDAQKQHQVKHE